MSASSEKEKRCLYEVLGLSRDCSTDEIRSAYRKLALQRHPDKLIKSGLSEAEATAQFQELVNAYEVLSDPRERSWYDSHRSQILFSSSTAGNSSNSVSVPDLFSYFSNSCYSGYSDSGKGFYKVYGEVFDKILQNEMTFAKKVGVGMPMDAPLIGNLGSPYAQVTAFYNYWVGFVTVMDFCWADQYDVMMGPNRKSRRVMEDENKKLRKKARREYNETIRGLAEFAKKRDKRVMDMMLKKSEEMEKKKEDERKRKEELARLRAEKLRDYEEPEWSKIDEFEDEEIEEEIEENGKTGNKDELYCVACSKKFKSEKQWKNHEQSKKHKEKVMELREAFVSEDREFEKEAYEEHEEGGEAANAFSQTDDGADELSEQIDNQTGIGENNDDGRVSSDADSLPSEDDEASMLESMVSGHKNKNKNKNKNKAGSKQNPDIVETIDQLHIDDDEMEYMEYTNTKGSRRNKGSRRQKNREPEEAKQNGFKAMNVQIEENTEQEDSSGIHEQSENLITSREDSTSEKVRKLPKEDVEKNTAKQDSKFKSKESAKGKKKKGSYKIQNNACEKCGEEFETRNKLHKHLGETGHASLKSR